MLISPSRYRTAMYRLFGAKEAERLMASAPPGFAYVPDHDRIARAEAAQSANHPITPDRTAGLNGRNKHHAAEDAKFLRHLNGAPPGYDDYGGVDWQHLPHWVLAQPRWRDATILTNHWCDLDAEINRTDRATLAESGRGRLERLEAMLYQPGMLRALSQKLKMPLDKTDVLMRFYGTHAQAGADARQGAYRIHDKLNKLRNVHVTEQDCCRLAAFGEAMIRSPFHDLDEQKERKKLTHSQRGLLMQQDIEQILTAPIPKAWNGYDHALQMAAFPPVPLSPIKKSNFLKKVHPKRILENVKTYPKYHTVMALGMLGAAGGELKSNLSENDRSVEVKTHPAPASVQFSDFGAEAGALRISAFPRMPHAARQWSTTVTQPSGDLGRVKQ